MVSYKRKLPLKILKKYNFFLEISNICINIIKYMKNTYYFYFLPLKWLFQYFIKFKKFKNITNSFIFTKYELTSKFIFNLKLIVMFRNF